MSAPIGEYISQITKIFTADSTSDLENIHHNTRILISYVTNLRMKSFQKINSFP